MQNFKQRFILLSAAPYSIENEKDGTKNEGVTAYMLYDDNLAHRFDEEAAGRNQEVLGLKPVKVTIPYKVKSNIKSVPGLYNVTCKMDIKRVTVRGRETEVAAIQPIDLDFIGALEVKAVAPKPDVSS
jgi:hypothetical protein